jgi:hypothetical protein
MDEQTQMTTDKPQPPFAVRWGHKRRDGSYDRTTWHATDDGTLTRCAHRIRHDARIVETDSVEKARCGQCARRKV